MIQNIIFDIGQVLAKFRWREYIEALGFTKDINERIAKATVLSFYWNEVDRGVMTMPEIIERCVALDPEIEAEIRLFYKDRKTMVVEFPYAKELVKGLKDAGYSIYLLSNYGEENFSYVKDIFTFMPYVDGKIISYEVKTIKPEPAIYQALLDTYPIRPEESVFLDDHKDNIEEAEKFGFQTILFTGLDQAKEELRRMGVRI